ncbi:Signal transduction histidine-protein kinase ArlS [Corynebacterium occultum]|uniref:histidine kinase n=1 Tax=Corynebacterium occultum TaxID=2675219 RepID=A0A6B8VVC4_9CORY|nr:ATP-binding protein [Corynebacterium occultum]QGU08093.1 Signal transduction histidine-protein kinase ArlS [Corynebacterium occultum]
MPPASRTPKLGAANSLRWRIIFWITCVVLVAMGTVILITRSVLQSQVTDSANQSVEQEIDEFTQFAADGTDPLTAAPFATPQRLIEVYLSRQIPDDDEILLGAVDGQLIQPDLSQLSGRFRGPLASDSALAGEILRSPTPSGVFSDPVDGAVHWGRVQFQSPDNNQEAYFAVAVHTHPAREMVDREVATLALIGSGGVVAAFLIAWLIAGQIIAPIRNLRQVAASISNSDLSQRVPVEGGDELAQLALTFNSMLDRIEAAYREQRQFVDDAGHELRTPITVVRGQLELLGSSTPEEQARSVELSTAELDRMARMVNDMLTLAVADSAGFVTPTPVEVAELTLDIEEKANTIIQRAQVVAVAEGEVPLDEQRVTEAVLELYRNALKYVEGDSDIDLGSEFKGCGEERMFRIWVRDRGPGVPVEMQEAVFGRFHRGEPSASARASGSGLGLSIVKAIAEAHGGRAYLDSTVGLGSIFGLELPAPEIVDPQDEESVGA